jgi:hypothetical protein
MDRSPRTPKSYVIFGLAGSVGVITAYVEAKDRPPQLPQAIRFSPTGAVANVFGGLFGKISCGHRRWAGGREVMVSYRGVRWMER